MKQLYLIGGTMGVGKTTVSQRLKETLPNSVLLDGDWCWDMHPFRVTDETKAMVLDNICHTLQNFIDCSAFEHVIFCWVMHRQDIIDHILSHLNTQGCRVVPISLLCSEPALTERLRRDVAAGLRRADVIERSVERIPLYRGLHTAKIDVSRLTVEETVRNILEL